MKSFHLSLLLLLILTSCRSPEFAADQKSAAAAISSLEHTDGDFYLFTLDPTGGLGYATNSDTVFHGFKIIDRRKIKDSETQTRLLQSLVDGVRSSDGTVAACFNPRHGIRIRKDGKNCDIVVCFECLSVRAFGFADDKWFLTTGTPFETFDEVCKALKMKQKKEES